MKKNKEYEDRRQAHLEQTQFDVEWLKTHNPTHINVSLRAQKPGNTNRYSININMIKNAGQLLKHKGKSTLQAKSTQYISNMVDKTRKREIFANMPQEQQQFSAWREIDHLYNKYDTCFAGKIRNRDSSGLHLPRFNITNSAICMYMDKNDDITAEIWFGKHHWRIPMTSTEDCSDATRQVFIAKGDLTIAQDDEQWI